MKNIRTINIKLFWIFKVVSDGLLNLVNVNIFSDKNAIDNIDQFANVVDNKIEDLINNDCRITVESINNKIFLLYVMPDVSYISIYADIIVDDINALAEIQNTTTDHIKEKIDIELFNNTIDKCKKNLVSWYKEKVLYLEDEDTINEAWKIINDINNTNDWSCLSKFIKRQDTLLALSSENWQ